MDDQEVTGAGQAQWTPGPWSFSRAALSCYAGSIVGQEFPEGGSPVVADICLRSTHGSDEANAHLIAAAPDLLDALERAVDALASLLGDDEPPLSQVVRGHAALAKARANGIASTTPAHD